MLVDVGAHRGTIASRFAASDWKVYCFEPNPRMREQLRSHLGWRSNVIIDGRVLSSTDGDVLPFFTSKVSSGISTLPPFHESHETTYSVETVRLSTITAELSIERIDILKVDVEVHEREVFRGFTFKPRPCIIDANSRSLIRLEEWHEAGKPINWRKEMRSQIPTIAAALLRDTQGAMRS